MHHGRSSGQARGYATAIAPEAEAGAKAKAGAVAEAGAVAAAEAEAKNGGFLYSFT